MSITIKTSGEGSANATDRPFTWSDGDSSIEVAGVAYTVTAIPAIGWRFDHFDIEYSRKQENSNGYNSNVTETYQSWENPLTGSYEQYGILAHPVEYTWRWSVGEIWERVRVYGVVVTAVFVHQSQQVDSHSLLHDNRGRLIHNSLGKLMHAGS